MSSSFRILPAGPDDLALVRTLAEVIWREHYPSILEVAQVDYMLERMYAPTVLERELGEGIAFDLAYVDERPVGYASYGPSGRPHEWKLHKLYVLATERGLGRGAAMLERVEQRARAAGARTVVLQVNKRNVVAIRAYERAGYRIRQAATFDIGGGYVMDDYVMERELADG
ncbi:MAG: GNAT family N-acetyltransferase [Polyangiales bacterium]